MTMGLKICGISDPKTLNYILNHRYKPSMIGFITNYKKSRRFIEYDKLQSLINIDKKNVSFVSVLVNPNEEILEKIKNLEFDYYQLYDVDPETTDLIKKKYKKKIISSITIENRDHFERYKLYENISDIILFDGKGYEKSISFDHQLLKNFPKNITFMLAGNITINNIPMIENKDYIIDLSGSLENKDGKKDIKKINEFLNKVKLI